MSDQDVKSIIKALEARRRSAMIEQDMDFLERIYSSDLTYSHSDGKSDSKGSYLEGMRKGVWFYKSLQSEQEQIRILGDCAIFNGLIEMDVIIRGEPLILNSRYISVWRSGDSGWQMVAWQSTRYSKI
jgi:ketosteroid isomerase-like protein